MQPVCSCICRCTVYWQCLLVGKKISSRTYCSLVWDTGLGNKTIAICIGDRHIVSTIKSGARKIWIRKAAHCFQTVFALIWWFACKSLLLIIIFSTSRAALLVNLLKQLAQRITWGSIYFDRWAICYFAAMLIVLALRLQAVCVDDKVVQNKVVTFFLRILLYFFLLETGLKKIINNYGYWLIWSILNAF